MKSLFFMLMLLISFSGIKNPENNNSGQLEQSELEFIQQQYNWNSSEVLIINFLQPQKSCFHSNYGHWKESNEWWQQFYSQLEMENYRSVFVYSESKKAKKVIDMKDHFPDHNNFLLENFFKDYQTCFGVLVISPTGKYEQKNGEYYQDDLREMIKSVR